jgi:hypothetical protein
MTCVVITVVLAGLAVCPSVGAQESQENTSGSKLKVGTFDSRALAMAHYRSEAFIHQMEEMRAEYTKAKEAGDEKRVKELGSGVEFIDVTDLMVKPFNPDEETLKTIKEIQKQDPVPLEELTNHQD